MTTFGNRCPWVSLLRATPLLVCAMAMPGINSLLPLPILRRSGIESSAFISKEGTDAAGFVAWLAGHLKRSAGTGSVVIYGKDRRDTSELFQTSQGVFDYWCCSVTAGEKFVAVIQSLIAQGQKLSS
jgi:hypothetical protein